MCNHIEEHNHEHEGFHGHCHENEHENSMLGIVLYVLSIILFAIGYIPAFEQYKMFIYLGAVLLSGYDLIFEGLKNILKLNFEEDTLMTIAVIAAFALGEYPESVLVILLFKLGEFLEDKARDKSNDNIEQIAKIKSENANLLNKNTIEVVDVKKLKLGDKILIKAGEKVPVDSKIIKGESTLDTSSITGESKPQEVSSGMEILSGSINMSGSLECEVIRTFENSTASQIVDLVHVAMGNKGKTEKFITKFSKVYTPTVIVLAVLIAVVIPLIFKQSFCEWIKRSLIFLVASCPCSLVISVPLAFFSCLGAISKKGMIIKGTKHIENLSKTTAVCFDKTGTLTTGKMEINEVKSLGELDKNTILEYVYNLEKSSNHPISTAIINMSKDLKNKEVDKNKEIAGHGMYGIIDNKEVLFGNKKLLDMYDVKYTNLEDGAIYLAIDKNLEGYITLKEELRNKDIVEEFKKVNIKRLVMLTGDSEKQANKVGKDLNISEVYAELLPQNKLDKVEELKKQNEKVTFIGDGINDSPVLASANFGIAMGEGTEIASSTADGILLSNNIATLPEIIKISRKSMRIVKANIIFSIVVKLIVLGLGVLGYAPIWLAVLADTGVTFLTVLNSMRIFKN